MRLVYICSPLRGDMEQNISRAHEYCAYAADCGVIPLAPHTIFTNYLDDRNPEQRQRGLSMGLELLKRCDEMWIVGGTVSEGMKGDLALAEKEHIPRLYVSDEMVRAKHKIRQDNEPFVYGDCIPGSEKTNYENQILVIKPEAFADKNSVTADDSLWIAHGGFGCTYGARGQSVFAESLLSGEKARWERFDFYGVVSPVNLLLWTFDKPVHNERADEIIERAQNLLTDQDYAAEDAEEAGAEP